MNWIKLKEKFNNQWFQLPDRDDVFNWFIDNIKSDYRTSAQNRALHLYFTKIAAQFINLGWTYNYICPFTGNTIDLPWTGNLVKDYMWKPIQKDLFNIDSTTKINTKQINSIIDVLSAHFGKHGVGVEFPNWQAYLNKIDAKTY